MSLKMSLTVFTKFQKQHILIRELSWMTNKYIKLKASKTELLMLPPKLHLPANHPSQLMQFHLSTPPDHKIWIHSWLLSIFYLISCVHTSKSYRLISKYVNNSTTFHHFHFNHLGPSHHGPSAMVSCFHHCPCYGWFSKGQSHWCV